MNHNFVNNLISFVCKNSMEKLAPGGFAHEPTIVVTKSQKKTETMIFCVHDAEANQKLGHSRLTIISF